MPGAHPQIPRNTIGKVLIKAVKGESSGKKAEGKTFTLRDIDPTKVKTCCHLKTLIRAQLQEDIRTGDFDVGYIQSNSVVTLRTPEDIQEIWSSLSKGTKVTLWCDGLRGSSNKGSRKRKQQRGDDSEDDDSDAESSSKSRKKTKDEEKDQEVQKLIDDLKSTYKDTYTTMQYRIWSEMILGGLHKSTDTAPSNPLFLRAGGNYPKKKPVQSDGDTVTLTKAVADIASAIVKSRPAPSPTSMVHSPAKIIDSRSKCYRQLSELKSLFESGLLSDEEYQVEREAIMNTLKKLTC